MGPSLAEKLGIPHTTNVKKIEEIKEGYIRCQRMTDDGYETIEMSLPAVITVVKEINEPRLPSLKASLEQKDRSKAVNSRRYRSEFMRFERITHSSDRNLRS